MQTCAPPFSITADIGHQVLAAGYALIGGLVLVALLPSLELGAFGVGLAVIITLAVVTGIRSKVPGALGILVAYSFAFLLLLSPARCSQCWLWGPGD